MLVLIADDDPIALALLSNSISSGGDDVICATNGQDALALYKKHSPRVVISDVSMPQMDGETLCRKIRDLAAMQYTYVILLTSNDNEEAVLSGLDAGADDYLTKPIQPKELRLRLEAGKRLLALEGRDMMIFSLAKLAESRDQETGKHLERMREYSKLLAVEMSSWPKFEDVIGAQFIELLYMTSPLHDVGKVGIPDRILCKPGKLTAEEFEIMKQHTTIGSETLKASADAHPEAKFLQMALDIAYMHHEKWDGSGYPQGLSGEDIPLSARIVALADVYDALTTFRVYKPAFSHEKARGIILDSRGSHFDPDVVDAFLKTEDQFIAICNAMDDEQEKTSEQDAAVEQTQPATLPQLNTDAFGVQTPSPIA